MKRYIAASMIVVAGFVGVGQVAGATVASTKSSDFLDAIHDAGFRGMDREALAFGKAFCKGASISPRRAVKSAFHGLQDEGRRVTKFIVSTVAYSVLYLCPEYEKAVDRAVAAGDY